MTPDEMQELSLERKLLASILTGPDLIERIRSIVSPEMFVSEMLREIYMVMLDIHASGEPIEPVLINRRMQSRDSLEIARATPVALVELIGLTHTSVYGVTYADEIRKRFWTVSGIEAARSGDVSDAILMLERARGSARSEGVDVLVDGAVEDSKKRRNMDAREFSMGINAVDEMLKIERQSLVTIGAQTSHGKSAFLLNLMMAWTHSGRRGILYNYESGAQSIVYRMAAILSMVDGNTIRFGRWVDGADEDRVRAAFDRIKEMGNRLSINHSSLLSQIENDVEEKRPDFIAIDYIQILASIEKSRSDESRATQMTRIMAQLENIAVKKNMVVVVVSQLNREGSKDSREPRLSDLKDSSGIEQSSHTVVFGYWPYKDDQNQPMTKWRMIVAKQKEGPIGATHLDFNPRCFRFAQWVEPSTTERRDLR